MTASLAVTGIGLLASNRPELGEGLLGALRHAALIVDNGRVAWVGEQRALPEAAGDQRLDARGACVLPGFVDAHTHLVFAGDRAGEFAARLAGEPYAAGGIRSTVAATRAASDAALLDGARRRAAAALRTGTTTMEVKSGYGLTVVDEARCLRTAAAIGADPALPAVVATFLGAHVVPAEHAGDPAAYVDLVRGPMLEACAPLADGCDAFCELGAFDAEASRDVLTAGAAHGLNVRLHANQLGPGPGARLAAELGAASADHLTHLTAGDVDALAGAGVVATLLPLAELSTRSPAAPARRLLNAGVTVALATDCNPGTSYTTSMPLIVALGCLHLGLTPDEAVRAATAGAAAALRLDDAGHLGIGARGDLVILAADSATHLAYRPGMDLVDTVVHGGRVVYSNR
jgi:imidazolonepropionase